MKTGDKQRIPSSRFSCISNMSGKYCVLLFLVFNCSLGLTLRNYVCPNLNIKNGHVRVRQRGRFARFSCNNGFLLSGEKYAACVRGQWELPLPKCVRPSCSKMRTSPNTYVHASLRGAVMHFSCKPEYQLKGATISYCDGRKWDANPPVCQKIGTRPAYYCDFEMEDICGWDHDVNHDFEWRRFRYNTPSGHVGTGPSFDHTKGEGKEGYYMYIESSSRFENDTARLVSPFYDKTENNTCFEFYYHMYGATMGILRVYLKKANDSWEFDPTTAFFEKSGNQGDQWYRSLSSLGPIDQDFQIVIEGVRGSSYVSDIAVDDVRVIENCGPEMLTTELETVTESLATESFPLIESCENRCGTLGGTPDPLYRINCDCDIDCVERNSCCLDYIAFCVLSGSEATTTQTDETTTETTTEKVTITSVVNRKPKPTLIILPPPATEEIIEKVLTTKATSTTSTTISSPIITTKKQILTTVQPKEENEIIKIIPRLNTISTTIADEDVEEMPRVTTNLIQKVDDELEEHLSPPIVIKTNMITERIVKQPTNNSKTIWITVGVMAAIVAILIIAIGFVKLRRTYFLRGIQCSGVNGDSQSDVRFLTSEEALDFRLAYADDDE